MWDRRTINNPGQVHFEIDQTQGDLCAAETASSATRFTYVESLILVPRDVYCSLRHLKILNIIPKRRLPREPHKIPNGTTLTADGVCLRDKRSLNHGLSLVIRTGFCDTEFEAGWHLTSPGTTPTNSHVRLRFTSGNQPK